MIFRSAIRRLTITFTLVQLLLLGVFALAIYTFVTRTFDFDAVARDGTAAVNAAELGFTTLRAGLAVSFLGLLLLAPLTGYLLARATLRPVRISYDAQQRFVDDASHEFRTPLSILQGEIELALSRHRTPVEYRRALAGSLEVVESLTSLTDALLLLARGTSTELIGTFEEVSLVEVARACAAQRDPGTGAGAEAGTGATIRVDILGAPRILGSPELVSRALLNLLDNAVKFASGDGTVVVTVLASSSRGIIRVRDTGPGMSADAARHAFDRFWRGDTARSQLGHGLGLALVQQICVAHHGQASLSSVEGDGTTVTLAFPLIPAVTQR